MEQFLAFVFYVIVGLYLLRLMFLYLFPWLVRRWMKRVVKRMEQQQNEHQAEPSSPNTSTRSKLDDLGEYVDFEEIKDDKT
ncbi:MAG TPA: hypothetical protein PKE03_07790 [Bacteroidales bacterium]|nr:hypothetical protein [Bacteroidales bacterium]